MKWEQQRLQVEKQSSINGVLVINKDSGPMSRDVVNKVSRILGTKKIGHTGTLDPMARGVLILTIGRCTKLSEFLTSKYKTYVAKFDLGYETDTLDSTGVAVLKSDIHPDKAQIEECIMSFKGRYLQEVPKYSAVKVDGRRLYDLARAQETVELPKREVEITDIKLLKSDGNHVEMECRVSKGTYIRSLIRDIGVKLGTYATMTDLLRKEQGNFSLDEAYKLENVENGDYSIKTIEEVLNDIDGIEVDEELYKKVSNGCKLTLDRTSEFIKFTLKNKVIALYKKDSNIYRMYFKNTE